MKKGIATLTLSLVLGLALPLNAQAIPLGTLDSSEYPYIGMIYMGGLFGTGVLIAPDVVLTAAHVADDYTPASSYFLTGPDGLSHEDAFAVASSVVHPSYDPFNGTFDFGLLFLEQPVELATYATLWASDPAELLGMPAELVGYGGNWKRRVGTGSIYGLMDGLLFTERLAEGGDSGGGLFVEIDGQNVLAGTLSFVLFGTYAGPVSDARSFIDEYAPNARWFGETAVDEPIAMPEPPALVLLSAGLFASLLTRRRATREDSSSRNR